MKRFKKALRVVLIVSLVSSALYSMGWSQETGTAGGGMSKATREELNMADLLLARPLGILAGIIGTGIFIVSLPFTIPTNSVNEAAQMLVTGPFQYSFVREFPDEDIAAPPVPQTYD
jgi:hypothetical protein